MFWGAANPDWRMCKHGRQQSPINIEPSHLLFDPNLRHIRINSSLVRGLLLNTGHDITLELKYEDSNIINLTSGPLSYTYTVSEIKFHLANNDSVGSEHRVAGESFPGEVTSSFWFCHLH
ncbi:carbonic anhydrase-related protein 10-like [Elysia marginata]|uniref:Carbonic anhydrase-related protein 10-like n=1 Tax=Elysia marginata TaxID=1093978 RepID=A0AAV4F694_9GAST|nr:carbonic anhydrase-related protein 10-like [Elysia marginata]